MATVIDNARAIANRIMTAQINFDVFDTLSQHRSKQRSIDVLEPYRTFVLYSIQANFNACVIELYSLFETRDDTINLPRLIKAQKESGALNESASCVIDAKLTEIKKSWKKVATLRNEIVGHKTNSKTPQQVYEKAAISPDEIEALISKTMDLYNALGFEREAFNLDVSGQINDLVTTLSKHKK
jgi:AbiU2